MHESFEDELKRRLQDYTEDPDDGLWTNIASKITSKVADPSWVVWSNRAGLALTAIIFLASLYDFNFNTNLAASLSQSVAQNKNANKVTTEEEDNLIATEENLKHENVSDVISKQSDEESLKTIDQNSKNQSVVSTAVQSTQTFDVKKSQTINGKKVRQISQWQKDDARLKSQIINATEHAVILASEDDNHGSAPAYNEINIPENKQNDSAEKNSLYAGIISTEKVMDAANENILLSNNIKNEAPTSGVKTNRDSIRFIVDGKDIKKESKPALVKDQREKAKRKVSMYFLAMPTFGYQRIVANRNDNIIIDNIKKVSAFSYKRLGIRAELGMMFPLSSKFNITGGILYYQRKQTISYVEKMLDNSNVTSADDQHVELAPHFVYQNKSFEYELKNVGVQLGANVVLSKNKFLHTAGGGIEFQKGLNKIGKEQKDFSGNPSTFVFYNIYYRVQYPAEGRLRAIFQPTFNYSLYLNQDMNAPFYVKPYGFGLNFGITYNF